MPETSSDDSTRRRELRQSRNSVATGIPNSSRPEGREPEGLPCAMELPSGRGFVLRRRSFDSLTRRHDSRGGKRVCQRFAMCLPARSEDWIGSSALRNQAVNVRDFLAEESSGDRKTNPPTPPYESTALPDRPFGRKTRRCGFRGSARRLRC